MRFHVRAQYRGMVYIANNMHRRMFYARGIDDINLLDLNQINAINLIINLGNRSFNFNSVTQLPLIMILGQNVFPLLELINF
jgi:hypothetical protein